MISQPTSPANKISSSKLGMSAQTDPNPHTADDYYQETYGNYETIKNTPSNFRRTSATLFAGVTAISLATLLALLRLKPTLYISIKSQFEQPVVIVLHNFISSCEFYASQCLDANNLIARYPFAPAINQPLLDITTHYGLNPNLLLSIYYLDTHSSFPESPNPALLNALASSLAQKTTPIIPRVYKHPQFGYFKLHQFNTENFAIFQLLAQISPEKELFLNFLQANIASNSSQPSLQEVYEHLKKITQ